jgi:hypothetical protein
MVLAATPNLASSGLRRRCSTATIDNDRIALMLCPSVLFAPTLMGHYYTLNALFQPPHTIMRRDMVLPALPNQASSGRVRSCSIVVTCVVRMSREYFLVYYRNHL